MKPVAQASRVSYVRALASPENINRVWYPVTLKKRKCRAYKERRWTMTRHTRENSQSGGLE